MKTNVISINDPVFPQDSEMTYVSHSSPAVSAYPTYTLRATPEPTINSTAKQSSSAKNSSTSTESNGSASTQPVAKQESSAKNTSTSTNSSLAIQSMSVAHSDSVQAMSLNAADNATCVISIQAGGKQPYQVGESVSLSGNNTASSTTYLFITGTGLPADGGMLSAPQSAVQNNVAASFDQCNVSDNNTWVYHWRVPSACSNGTYTLYAEGKPNSLSGMNGSVNGTMQVSVKAEEVSSFPVVSGWNYLSTPSYFLENNSTIRIFAGVNSSGHSIFSFDGQNQSWKTLKGDDLFAPYTSVWLYSTSAESVAYTKSDKKIDPRSLFTGWNGIGIIDQNKTVNQSLQSLGANWSYLLGYNQTIQQYDAPILREQPEVNTTKMYIRHGYWIYMNQNSTLSE